MDHYLAEQYLARIGYFSPRPEPQTPELEIEASPPNLKYSQKQQPTSPSPPPARPVSAQILADLYLELENRHNICLRIKCQIEACQNEIRSLPSKRKKIKKGHEKRIANFDKAAQDERQKWLDAGRRTNAQTAEVEEMRNIYLQYDRESIQVPAAESVDAFFVIVANTEQHLMKAEEANKAAKRREVTLEKKLYRARCAVFEMEDEIENVESETMENKAWEPEVEKCRVGCHKGSKKRTRRRKKPKGRHQGQRGGGGERPGRSQKR